MTSSFGTVVGTPRDKLPNISETNYDRVTPDLSEAVNKQIDKNIVDTKDFFGDMMSEGQNDYPLAKAVEDMGGYTYHVRDFRHTWSLLNKV